MHAITIIATVLNERDSIEPLINSLLTQTEPVEAIVFVDGGSTDGTWEWLSEAQARIPILHPIRDESCNRKHSQGPIARGRNTAVAAARTPVIAIVDGGCRYQPTWLELLVAPILAGSAEYSLGGACLDPENRTDADIASSIFLGIKLNMTEPTKSCSTRSMAFRKDLWQQVGGFPENAFFGDDTIFHEEMCKITNPAYPIGAKAFYRPGNNFRAAQRQLASYARADGILGLRPSRFFRHAMRCVAELVALICLSYTWIPLACILALELYLAFYHDWRDLLRTSPRTILTRIAFAFSVPWIVAWNNISGLLTKAYLQNRQNND